MTVHLDSFSKSFKGVEVKKLDGNFRSSPDICKFTSMIRPSASKGVYDRSIGPNKIVTHPVYLLSYAGQGVPSSIGVKFKELVILSGEDISKCPVLAATANSGLNAIGKGGKKAKEDMTFRLAKAVLEFHNSRSFSGIQSSITEIHKIMLEIESGVSANEYHKYISDLDDDPIEIRPRLISLLQQLKFSDKHLNDLRSWHENMKQVIGSQLVLTGDKSVGQLLRWNSSIDTLLSFDDNDLVSRTIHSVKGKEFPAVCVVTVPQTFKGLMDHLEKGDDESKSEDTRKLYVAASRAERLLVFAVPKFQVVRAKKFMGSNGARIEVIDI